MKRINNRDTLNFFSDEGLFTNYAFPEAGMTLHSIFYRRTETTEEDGRKYEHWTQEFERSAESALSELAPNSKF